MKNQIERDAENYRLQLAQEIIDRYNEYKESEEFAEWKSENKKIMRSFDKWVKSYAKEILRGEIIYEEFFDKIEGEYNITIKSSIRKSILKYSNINK